MVSVVVEAEEARLQAKLRKLAAVQAKVQSDVAAAKAALSALQALVAAREAELVARATDRAAADDEVEWRARDVALAVLQQIKIEVRGRRGRLSLSPRTDSTETRPATLVRRAQAQNETDQNSRPKPSALSIDGELRRRPAPGGPRGGARR